MGTGPAGRDGLAPSAAGRGRDRPACRPAAGSCVDATARAQDRSRSPVLPAPRPAGCAAEMRHPILGRGRRRPVRAERLPRGPSEEFLTEGAEAPAASPPPGLPWPRERRATITAARTARSMPHPGNGRRVSRPEGGRPEPGARQAASLAALSWPAPRAATRPPVALRFACGPFAPRRGLQRGPQPRGRGFPAGWGVGIWVTFPAPGAAGRTGESVPIR